LANFYKKFINDFSTLVKPFIDLRKKEGSFKWKDKQQNVFALLKGKLWSAPMLRFSDFIKSFEVHIDASGFVISGVLMQEGIQSVATLLWPSVGVKPNTWKK
jgi:hypothetical protein